MTRNFPGRRARRAVGVLLLALLVAILLVGFELQRRYQWAAETLDMVEPRYARLAGVQQVAGEINGALQASQQTLAQFVYPASEAVERIGTDLQQRVRALATESGMSVPNSSILPLAVGETVDVVAVMLTVQGDANQLQQLLLAMQRETPTLQVDVAQIAMARGRNARDRFTAQLTISAMRMKS